MGDTDSPEQGASQQPQPPNPPRVRRPLSDFFQPREPKPHQPSDDSAVQPAGLSPEDIEKDPMKLGAIKLAELEKEILQLANATPTETITYNTGFDEEGIAQPTEDVRIVKYKDGAVTIVANAFNKNREELYPIRKFDGTPALIKYFTGGEIAKQLRSAHPSIIDTDSYLTIETHADDQTREAFEKFAKKHPESARRHITKYYFNEQGDYGKELTVALDFPMPSDYTLQTSGISAAVFRGPAMTAGDFEIAGRALVLLKAGLVPPGEATPTEK